MQISISGVTTVTRQVILIPDETGWFTVEVPSLPGCISQGQTVEEALVNIREAITLHIESLVAHGEEVPGDVPAPIQVATVAA
jgi:predicted RNase H-like HicB family nuclease